MNVPFVAELRKQSQSFVITIPSVVVKKANLKVGEIPEFRLVLGDLMPQKDMPNSLSNKLLFYILMF